jgi:RIO kinase 1
VNDYNYSNDLSFDEFEIYEELFDPMRTDRKARRKRKPKARHKPKKQDAQIVAELADDMVGLEGGFKTTYTPSRYEEEWLLSSLRSFYDRGFINDVLAVVKGGKEASVYRCQADAATGATVLAAKVYRPRKFRSLRNDSVYRQGRAILNAYGQDHDFARDQRILRAVAKKTAFGFQVRHTSWLMHEYTALERLYLAGAAVPQPISSNNNAILMSYHGDARMAAPTLNQVRLELNEAETLFQELLRNIALMLQHELIHGDLSAYNILYWKGEITIIDFPQVTNLHANENSYSILRRDVQRVCEYFAQQGVQCDPETVMGELWYQYGYGDR